MVTLRMIQGTSVRGSTSVSADVEPVRRVKSAPRDAPDLVSVRAPDDLRAVDEVHQVEQAENDNDIGRESNLFLWCVFALGALPFVGRLLSLQVSDGELGIGTLFLLLAGHQLVTLWWRR